MCGTDSDDLPRAVTLGAPKLGKRDVMSVAREIARHPEVRRTASGFIGFGATKPGDRVLLAMDNHYEAEVWKAIAAALREAGASVDVVIADAGPDREFEDLDEIRAAIRSQPWVEKPRRWEGLPWVEELALRGNYDLLVHGKGGAIPKTAPHRYEGLPWLTVEHFLQGATTYPRDLHVLLNERTWANFHGRGKGGRVHVTDPEGTDLSFTLWEEYFDRPPTPKTLVYGPTPHWGHIMGHAPTPIIEREDAEGVVAGTTSHFARPFPNAKVYLRDGQVTHVDGGGAYGEAWRDLLKKTADIQYPAFPRPGLFWLWEIAIGTNPKIARPHNIDRLSSGGFEWERRRAGVIHAGFGSLWRSKEEIWAGEQRILYGHLHIHLLFPTLTITTKTGEVIPIIEHGRLSVFDDPEVRALASKYGDPDQLLSADWIPAIPGISAEGSYETYAKNPAAFIYRRTSA